MPTEAGRLLGSAFFFSSSAVCGALCYWQIKRRTWKENLIEQRLKGMEEEPLRLNELVRRDNSAFEEWYDGCRKFIAEGQLETSKSFLVGPRSNPNSTKIGYHIITPLLLSKTEPPSYVMVYRGWVPKDWKEKSKSSMVSIEGLLKKGDKGAPIWGVGAKDEHSGTWMYTNLPMLQKEFEEGQNGLHSIPFLLQVIGKDENKIPIASSHNSLVEFHTTPTIHNIYALTWGSLSLTILGMTFKWMKQAKKGL